MSARRIPVTASLPVASLVFHLYRHDCGTVAFGLQADLQRDRGEIPDFTGFPDRETPTQLRALADRIEGLMS
jgi:hypothetical protein